LVDERKKALEARRVRLAAALRENLGRRKAEQRARAADSAVAKGPAKKASPGTAE
jgi:hypothetical protein